MKIYFQVCLFAIFLATTACTATKKANKTAEQKGEMTAELLIKTVEKQAINYEWFDGRAKLKYVDMSQNRSIRANIRIQKDSLIWMSFQLLGIEGARVKITPDTVYVLNRLNQEYMVKPLSFIEDNYNLPADFNAIAALLVGSPYFYNTPHLLEEQDSVYVLRASEPLKTIYGIDKKDLKILDLTLEDKNKQTVEVLFKSYAALDEKQIFSYFRDIVISSPTQGNASVEIEYTKVTFDEPANVSFSVPEKYKVVR